MEVDPTGDLLEADTYTVEEVPVAAVMRVVPMIRNTEIVIVTSTWA